MNMTSLLWQSKRILRVLPVFITVFFLSGQIVLATESPSSTEVIEESFQEFQEALLLGSNTTDLCAWERNLGFFLSRVRSEEGVDQGDRIACELRLQNDKVSGEIGEMKREYQNEKTLLAHELKELVADYPIEVMVPAIASYDREIAGLIVGIGKKESNWGKRTPKLSGEECYNFWGYRGVGSRGLTNDGYGCWNTPEEAVKTIGDRLEKLRDVRSSTEPARMIVWKCGNSCAGHSEESIQKWIADVNFYYREIAQK